LRLVSVKYIVSFSSVGVVWRYEHINRCLTLRARSQHSARDSVVFVHRSTVFLA